MALEQAHLRAVEVTLADGPDGKKVPPKEFRIFPAGLLDTSKGPFTFTEQSGRDVMARYAEAGHDVAVDYNHGMADPWPVDPSQSGKAAGWFKQELRGGELWAVDVSWTPVAYAALENREWRYISPWFYFDGETRRIIELRNVALTNDPATKNPIPLMANRHGGNPVEPENMNQKMLALLGLAATATEAEVQAAIATLNNNATAAAATKTQVDELLSLTGKATLSEALGAARGWKASHEALPGVQEKLNKLEGDTAAAKLTALLDKASDEGKVTPAMRPALEALGKKDIVQLEAMLNVMVVVKPGATMAATQATNATEAVTLSADELAVAKASGLTPEQFFKAKAEQAKARAA